MKEENKNILRTFIDWAKLKVKIHFSADKEIYPKPREIWVVSIDQNIGVEINGKNNDFARPVLIVKVFNRFGVLVVPISSTIVDDKYCIKFINENGKENIIKMSQLRAISTKRFLRKVWDLKIEDFDKVKKLYKTFA